MNNRINIVIADDDLDDHLFFEEALRSVQPANFGITSFYNGRQLLDYLEAFGPSDILPDVIIIDLNMHFLDGQNTLTKIKASPRLQHIPVFILTTAASNDQKKKCAETGCSGYYIKPIKLKELEVIIQEILLKAVAA